MALTLKNKKYPWLVYLSHVNSTNNYAMEYISDEVAQHGMVIAAEKQLQPKAQREKIWKNEDEDIKMSLILKAPFEADKIFVFSMLIALAVQYVLEENLPKSADVKIKWPNDIYINERKSTGILIENNFSDGKWNWAVVGIGQNVKSKIDFHELNAIGLEDILKEQELDPFWWMQEIRNAILNFLHIYKNPENIITAYNALLFRKNKIQEFVVLDDNKTFKAKIIKINTKGQLVLEEENGAISTWIHGSIKWVF